jgi:pimeloyl-ACP methyl ester carboxylesterase
VTLEASAWSSRRRRGRRLRHGGGRGEFNTDVPLADQAELALRCYGVLVPIKGVGHAPFLERPGDTVAWIRATAGRAAVAARSPT